METTKTRKAKMRSVKKYLLVGLLLAVGCATSLPLQQAINVIFYLKLIPGDVSVRYQFNETTFKIKSSGNLETGYNARGSYRIAGDTLILEYELFERPESSTS